MKRKHTIKSRLKSPTPPFFKKVQKAGLMLSAAGAAIITAPVSLPLAITSAGAYLLTAGLVASAVSSVTVEKEECGDG